MAGPHVVSILSKKYAKLLGEREFAERMTEDAMGLDAILEATHQCDRRKKEIDEKLEAIETVIWLFDAEWDPATVRPNYPRNRYHKPGTISRAAYAVLRDAKHPLTTRQITRMVIERIGMAKPEERDVNRIDIAVHNALNSRDGRTVRIEQYNPIRWVLIPREHALPRIKKRVPRSGIEKLLPRATGKRVS